jgi:hypothetical protein
MLAENAVSGDCGRIVDDNFHYHPTRSIGEGSEIVSTAAAP